MLSHLSRLGLRVNWVKSKLSPMQRISFLGMELDSVEQTARLTEECAQSVLNCLNMFKSRTVVPLKWFQSLLGHMAAAAVVTPLGLLHMRPLQHWLHGRVLRWQCRTHRVQVTSACRQTFTLWPDLAFLWAGVHLEQVSRHAVVYTDASTTGWRATYDGHAVSGVRTGPQLHWHINCLELLAVRLALNHSWPRGLCKYALPPMSLLAQTLCKIREDEEQVLLVAPYWPTRTWFPELMLLVTAHAWLIPLRKDLLTQRQGTLWHPRPDLWKLHVWSLDGTRRFYVTYPKR